jgi:hypothetical protein
MKSKKVRHPSSVLWRKEKVICCIDVDDARGYTLKISGYKEIVIPEKGVCPFFLTGL